MSAESGDKQSVRLSIYNQNFTLLVAGDPAELEAAANEVDELMHTIAKTGNMDSTRVAVLACLHLQDRLRTLERDFTELQARVEDKTRRLTSLLDGVLPSDTP